MTFIAPRLEDDPVHVWRASLDHDAHVIRSLERWLVDDELRRAGEFRFARDRSRFVASRGILRTLLGAHLGVPPREVALRYGEFDKPSVAGPGPWFNVSHSGPIALFALSASMEIGVDVEQAGPQPDAERIAKRFFSAAECAELRSLPEDRRATAFLRCWTRKEAFLKARGDGLSLALDAFDVSLGPDAPCRLLRTAWSDQEPACWQLVDISDSEGAYIAALAARGTGWSFRLRDLDIPLVTHDTMTLQETIK